MEAVARLAAGIAHELSDGTARMDAAVRSALARLSPSDAARIPLDDALRSADAAAALATQLQAVGRDRHHVPRVIDPGDVVRRGLPSLRLLAGGIEITLALDPATRPVRVDPGLLSQVLLHLVATASAAMAESGRINIATYTTEVGPRPPAGTDLSSGAYVVLEVRDERKHLPGSLERMFEPYAPTGSGAAPGAPQLGLAAAHGLVTSAGGRISAEAATDGGLIVRVWLRPVEEPAMG
jgi:signal transduction histidine kinase